MAAVLPHHDPEVTPLCAAHQPAISSHFLRLGANARRARFGNAVSAEFAERYAGRILRMDGAVYGVIIAGELRALAELRELRDKRPIIAEAAFSVEPDWQGQGLGTRLMTYIVASARSRGIKSLNMLCLSSNKRMQRIAARYTDLMRFSSTEIVSSLDFY